MKKLFLLSLFGVFVMANEGEAIAKIIKQYQVECASGNGASCDKLSKIHNFLMNNQDFFTNNQNNLISLEKDCNNKNYKVCEELGDKYYMGDGVNTDLDKALLYYNKACKGSVACNKVNATKNAKQRIENIVNNYYQNQANTNNQNSYNPNDISSKNTYDPYNTYYVRNGKRYMLPSTCPMGADKDKAYMYAIEYLKVGNGKEAKRCLLKGCDRKYSPLAKSCTKLGDMHFSGNGAEFSYDLALKYYKKGCELGDSYACLGTKKVADALKEEKEKNKYEVIIRK